MKAKKFIRSNPHLPVKNLRQTLDYYRDTLGFYDEWTWTNDDGDAVDGGIRRDDMRLLFGEDPDYTAIINSYKKSRLSIMWFVENIDEIYAEFQTRDIELADTLKTHAYSLREFCFIDINGYLIRVAEGTEE
jgi:catechol 2,3-dioxygenase-like lactoylglutathione lyase family enzyme